MLNGGSVRDQVSVDSCTVCGGFVRSHNSFGRASCERTAQLKTI